MAQFEKYSPKQLVKDVGPGAVDAKGNRLFLPSFLINAKNTHINTTSGGGAGTIENIKGTLLRNFDLPTGRNKNVGSVFNIRDNSIIYFVWNENLNHLVMEYSVDADTFTVLLSGSSLNFTENQFIFQGGIIGEELFWNEKDNVTRQINLARARSGGYTAPYSIQSLSLLKKPPVNRPQAVKATDATKKFNYIAGENFQFFIRYIYEDNQRSVFSPLSALVTADFYPDTFDTTNNVINVSFNFDIALTDVVIAIEVGYRQSNEGNYNIFKTIKNPDQASYIIAFTGKGKTTTVPFSEELHYFENLGNNPRSLAIIKNTLIAERGEWGFDFSTSEVTFSATPKEYTPTAGGETRAWKQGSTPFLGIIYRDGFGRTSFVKNEIELEIPILPALSPFLTVPYAASNERHYIEWSLSGTPPPEAETYQIVVKPDSFYNAYQQYEVNVFFYFGKERSDGTVGSGEVLIDGNLFLKEATEGITRSLYMNFPVNGAFVPDTECKIRVATTEYDGYEGPEFLDVIDIQGQFMVVDIPWEFDEDNEDQVAPIDDFPKKLTIEVFKIQKEEDSRYYAYSDIFEISEGIFQTPSGTLYGDCYRVDTRVVDDNQFRFLYPDIFNEDDQGLEFTQGRASGQLFLESPTPTTNQINPDVGDDTDNVIVTSIFGFGPHTFVRSGSAKGLLEGKFPGVTFSTGHVLDYSKADGDYGQVYVVNDNERKTSQGNIIVFSNKIVEDSYINGANTFLAENRYVLPSERTKVRGLYKVNDNLIALHERETSSLYISEGLIRQGQDFILAKTEDFIGDDRELQLDYGSINPESAVLVYGMLFYWDMYKGAFVRYSSEGLYPVSEYGNKKYFYNKSKEYLPYKDTVKIITGVDYDNDEVILTFPDVIVNGDTIINGESIAFNFKEKVWTSPYSFIPEGYVAVNKKLFSFKNGELWEHEANSIYNSFYGVATKRKFTFVCNTFPGKNKRLLNIHIKAESISSDSTGNEKIVVIKTPEGQETYLRACEFELDEEVWKAEALQDINTESKFLEDGQSALRSGSDIVSHQFFVTVINSQQTVARLEWVNVVFKTEELTI